MTLEHCSKCVISTRAQETRHCESQSDVIARKVLTAGIVCFQRAPRRTICENTAIRWGRQIDRKCYSGLTNRASLKSNDALSFISEDCPHNPREYPQLHTLPRASQAITLSDDLEEYRCHAGKASCTLFTRSSQG